MKLGIIDYGAGNLHSVVNVIKSIGYEGSLVASADELEGITHLVLPGVGSFGDSMDALNSRGLTQAIRDWIAADKPFFGICLGYQVLFESSEESPGVEGLGVFKGRVVRFPKSDLKVPHMGWNSVTPVSHQDSVWKGMDAEPYLYFVHSYFPQPEDESIISGTCDYGGDFAAAIARGRLVACQCHPEKSQIAGQTLLANFLSQVV